MEEAVARELADLMAYRLHLPLNIDESALKAPLTLAGLLKIAFMLATTVRRALPESDGGFHIPEKLMTAMFASTIDPNALREYFFEALRQSSEDPMDLRATIEGAPIQLGFAECRKEVFETINKLWPAPPPGRPNKIEQSDFPSLFERSERLRPLFYDLLDLQERFPSRDLASLLEFLRADYVDEFVYVSKRLPNIAEWLSESKALERAKTKRARSRMLADLMAASDYGLAPRFALQKAQEARRFVVGKERQYKPRLKRIEVLEQLKALRQKSSEFPVPKSV